MVIRSVESQSHRLEECRWPGPGVDVCVAAGVREGEELTVEESLGLNQSFNPLPIFL